MTRPTALVTGAASGIGAAAVTRLIADGYRVVAFDIQEERLAQLCERIGDDTLLIAVAGDIRSAADLQLLKARVCQWSKTLDVLICSAGMLRVGPLADTEESDWDLLFDVNVKGAYLTLRAFGPLLMRSGDCTRRASVIVLTSAAAARPKIGGGAYAATKAALTQIVRVWSVELAPHGVNVNALAPGTVNTPMSATLSSGAGTFKLSGAAPIGRMAEPEDIADAISLLYDERARFITGAVLAVDGGLTAAYIPSILKPR
ncbi:MAG: SDR family oxidoreductase [Pseudomonadota bacterium]